MTKWLYAASKALASQGDTLLLACESGFIWRSFYNIKGGAYRVRQGHPARR
jgi:hypothetical protein